ncbi:MAG: hypothetical protein KKF08_18890 [Gammaproteobacteria bacterium]|nr:hypothetical protein [Gammaproteobacteria bacterium]
MDFWLPVILFGIGGLFVAFLFKVQARERRVRWYSLAAIVGLLAGFGVFLGVVNKDRGKADAACQQLCQEEEQLEGKLSSDEEHCECYKELDLPE